MAKRPWRIFKEIERAYTRFSYSKSLNKIPGAPPTKLRMIIMGNKTKVLKDWKYVGHLISLLNIQISDYSLEAVRINLLKYLEKDVKDFMFIIRKYPHHIVREHPIVYGGGGVAADRISQGMRLSFGKPMYRAAQIYRKDIVLSIYFDNEQVIPIIKKLLKIARNKLSGSYFEYVGKNLDEKEILKLVK
ncbi:MAG: 50S ribosomal protein L16 [Candidatus Aenigmatarchaeota archaeon]